MKSLLLFYIAIFFPMTVIAELAKNGMDSSLFVLLLFIYAFLYNPLISGWRLISLGLIEKKDLIKAFIPGYYNLKYFSALFYP